MNRLGHTESVHGIWYSLLFLAYFAHLTQYFLHLPNLATPPGHSLTVLTDLGKEESTLMTFYYKKKEEKYSKKQKKTCPNSESPFFALFL